MNLHIPEWVTILFFVIAGLVGIGITVGGFLTKVHEEILEDERREKEEKRERKNETNY